MIEIPCKCGPLEKVHPKELERAYLVCDDCFKANRIRGIKQVGTKDCWEYIPDNLMFVEQLAKERGLI